MINNRIQIVTERPLPQYATPGAAAFDVAADLAEALSIFPGEVAKIPTGVKLGVPPGTALFILPRSHFGRKHIKIANSPGLLDEDFIGEMFVLLENQSQELLVIKPGDIVAQCMLVPYIRAEFFRVPSLTPTVRGEGGEGHTGGVL